MKLFKKQVKNEKGFTLVELLAVVVILGIIAAIAIPAIGTIMKNSEKDAHVVNVKQMANAARMYIANEETVPASMTLKQLEEGGFIENITDPSVKGTTYDRAKSMVEYTAPVTTGTDPKGAVYKVTLISSDGNVTYIAEDSSKVKREDIDLK